MLYQQDTYSTVIANACCFPASIVSTGVTLVELETVVLIPAHVQQGHSEGPFAFKMHTLFALTYSEHYTHYQGNKTHSNREIRILYFQCSCSSVFLDCSCFQLGIISNVMLKQISAHIFDIRHITSPMQ